MHTYMHVTHAHEHRVSSSDTHSMHIYRMHTYLHMHRLHTHRMHRECRHAPHARHARMAASSSAQYESDNETHDGVRSSRSSRSSSMRRGDETVSATTTTTARGATRAGAGRMTDRIAAQDRRRAAHVVADPVGLKAPVRGVPAGVLDHRARRRAPIENNRFGNCLMRTRCPRYGCESAWHRVMR